MKQVEIKIKTVNAAFQIKSRFEVSRILREIAEKLDAGEYPEIARDSNGNPVGKIKIQ